MIRAYPRHPSLQAGETLVLHVSTDSPRFRVAFFRQGAALERMAGLPDRTLPGRHLPDGPTDRDWGWPGYRFAIPADWPSGVYVAMLVEIAADGSAALDRAPAFNPQAALVDIGLPGIDGYEVARGLRKLLNDRVMLIALTGFSAPADRQQALKAGCDAHLVKPIDHDALDALLARAGIDQKT